LSDAAVVADTSPLIGLARIELLPVLSQLFTTVYAPAAVVAEATRDADRPGAAAIQQALRDGALIARDVEPTPELNALTAVLDEGEAEALLLAQQLGFPVLIDERKGRGVAKAMGLTVIGTGAVLIAAKNRGLIISVAPYLVRLQESGYRLSKALISAILQRCGEA